MVLAVGEVLVLVLLAALLVVGGWTLWKFWAGPPPVDPGVAGALPPAERARVAAAIAAARWAPAHDEVDGATRVLVRRSYTGLDGHPVVLEDRVIATFPADDPEWEVRFIEGMSQARFRCTYLNAET